MKVEIAIVHNLLGGIPPEDMPEDEGLFWKAVAMELASLLHLSQRAEDPQIVFRDCRKSGDQYLWEFFVNDLNVQKRDAINWHGQNTSQWCYAGAITLQAGRVSMHH